MILRCAIIVGRNGPWPSSMGQKVNVDNPPGAGIIYNIYLSIDPSNRVVIVHITHGRTIFATFARKAAEYYYYFPCTCRVNHIFFHPRP